MTALEIVDCKPFRVACTKPLVLSLCVSMSAGMFCTYLCVDSQEAWVCHRQSGRSHRGGDRGARGRAHQGNALHYVPVWRPLMRGRGWMRGLGRPRRGFLFSVIVPCVHCDCSMYRRLFGWNIPQQCPSTPSFSTESPPSSPVPTCTPRPLPLPLLLSLRVHMSFCISLLCLCLSLVSMSLLCFSVNICFCFVVFWWW